MPLRDHLAMARAVYGRNRGLAPKAVPADRRTPPPLDYPYGEAGAGPPLVLVHGMVDQQETWRFNRDALAEHFRVISLDLPGCNHMPRRGEATLEGSADFLGEFVDALRLDRFLLLGMSLGSWVVLEYAARHPARVAGAALAGLPLARPTEGGRRLGRLIAEHKHRAPLQAFVAAAKGSRPYAHFVMSAVTHASNPHLAFNASLLANGQSSSDALTWLDNFQSMLEVDAEALLARLARTGVPYAAIFGDRDGQVGLDRIAQIDALAGHVILVPNARHCVHI
ncbi:MAG TPA: alpha/beta fold hydrolase, partial [Polyangiaceae bacterium]|nr:alpha/beta fold hydrolase [Polyangiaceae bacterium]